MKTLAITLILSFVTLGLFSQEFEVPKNYKLKKAADFDKYEKDFIKTVDWLMETPINKFGTKRKQAGAFVLAWVSGSPKVSIEIRQEIVTFMDSPDLLIIFMGAWAKNSLETGVFDDKYQGSLAGINAVIDFYTKNLEFMKKDKNIEKYIKMKNKGTLEAYIKKNA